MDERVVTTVDRWGHVRVIGGHITVKLQPDEDKKVKRIPPENKYSPCPHCKKSTGPPDGNGWFYCEGCYTPWRDN